MPWHSRTCPQSNSLTVYLLLQPDMLEWTKTSEGAVWAVCLRITISQNGNECWNKQPQQSLHEEEQKSPEAESFDPLTHFHGKHHIMQTKAKDQKTLGIVCAFCASLRLSDISKKFPGELVR